MCLLLSAAASLHAHALRGALCHSGNRCSWLNHDIIKDQGTGVGERVCACMRVCIQRRGEGNLATSPVSKVHYLARRVVTYSLSFYPGCVSVYNPGKVIGVGIV